MLLVGVTIARNEADVIELSIRHNLSALDGIAIVDHGSVDGTSEILAALVREGLPLVVARDDTPEFDQPKMMNRLVRHVFATSGADWVFPLDADEFLKVRARKDLESAAGAIPDDYHAQLEWQTYVPRFGGAEDVNAAIRSARRLAHERHGCSKIAVSREFAAATGRSIANGNHGIVADGPPPTALPGARLDPGTVAIAHVPVRSAAQFATKIAVGWLATLASRAYGGLDSFHWKEAFGYLRSGRPLTPSQLTAFAANYGVPHERWLPIDAIDMVDDPIAASVDPVYAHLAHCDPLPIVLAHAERLLTKT